METDTLIHKERLIKSSEQLKKLLMVSTWQKKRWRMFVQVCWASCVSLFVHILGGREARHNIILTFHSYFCYVKNSIYWASCVSSLHKVVWPVHLVRCLGGCCSCLMWSFHRRSNAYLEKVLVHYEKRITHYNVKRSSLSNTVFSEFYIHSYVATLMCWYFCSLQLCICYSRWHDVMMEMA